MKALRALGHPLARIAVQPSRLAFLGAQSRLEEVQRGQLASLLKLLEDVPEVRQKGLSSRSRWEDFAQAMPVTTYNDWADAITAQKAGNGRQLINSPVQRYQPTSGSTSAVKWIPYTKRFLHELDAAICPWMGDLYKRFPKARQGVHYWSLSWVPTEMRAQTQGHINDDMKLLSFGKRWLIGATQAVPDQISLAETSDHSFFANVAYLAARQDLAAISIWSPTFGLGLMEKMSMWRETLVEVLRTGRWDAYSNALDFLPCPRSETAAALLSSWNGAITADFFRELGPQLALVSSWDTASSSTWASRLQELLPHAAFQGKGLWATEGVITFPQGDRHVLAARSHVYEFEDVSSGRIVPPWQLEQGQEVIPLMSTGSGLLRYKMSDVVRVDSFMGQLPCLRFLGRNDGVDLAGEKISTVLAQTLLDELDWPAGINPVALLGADQGSEDGRPAYVLLAEALHNQPADVLDRHAQRLQSQLEERLYGHFHYAVARNLDQLGPVRCIIDTSARQHYLNKCRERGMIEGNIKIEALRHWTGALPVADATDSARTGAIRKVV